MKSSDLSPAISSGNGRVILWRCVLALALVQGAITLSWVIYKAYLPKLLGQFGFPAAFAATILLIENILAVGMEPFFGGMSDRGKRFMGTGFPLISLGVILSSALFILIPCFVIFLPPNVIWKYLLPAFLILWSLAMTMFRSPVIALLGQYAAVPALPQAASFLMVAGGLIAAFAPVSQQFLLSLGPVVTFGAGSIVLLLAVLVLRSLHPPLSAPQTSLSVASPFPLPAFGLIFLTGIFVSLAITFAMSTLPKLLRTNISLQLDVKSTMFVIAILIALAALPAGWLATRLGSRRGILTGMVVAACALLLWLIPAAGILGLVGMIAGLSLVNVGVFPFALGLMPASRAGLAIGGYFGGVGAGASLLPVVFGPVDKIPAVGGAMLGVLMFVLAGACVVLSGNVQASRNNF
ncbi:hypothetical protein NG798_16005 [Ancylothrix sp. C2]|uniref:MFS transporter n=1 Tax=Ancylothrix sp. D3o TaxID=2953691 RepID=UPI0021BA8C1E|nr:MFS transporter [Ancylothrix sp. D3o]MCT7951305.1 hypothetical protein [Ancylothrix sp. D3o]